jgi:hypothetical protein
MNKYLSFALYCTLYSIRLPKSGIGPSTNDVALQHRTRHDNRALTKVI